MVGRQLGVTGEVATVEGQMGVVKGREYKGGGGGGSQWYVRREMQGRW